jgi:hypothetical protein
MIDEISRPRFVKKYSPDQGGNDFLGLRAVNTNLMSLCLPGINNVTTHVRPFSIIAWIYWKFHELATEARLKSVSNTDLRVWQEKIEILFTWSHVLNNVAGIPGTLSLPPSSGYVPLDFESWKRQFGSTSLMAAIQYGPAAKAPDGLGFIEQTESGGFRTTGNGNQMAAALDRRLNGVGRPKLLRNIGAASARADEVKDLFQRWSVLSPSESERKSFWSAFYSESAIGQKSRTGNRSATVGLILRLLNASDKPLTAEQIRVGLFHGMVSSSKPSTVPKELTLYWHRWICLQVRQAQRLALEAILGWLERHLKDKREHDPAAVAEFVDKLWADNVLLLAHGSDIRTIRATLAGSDLNFLLRRSKVDESSSIFDLMTQVRRSFDDYDDRVVVHALRTLFVSAEFTKALAEVGNIQAELNLGSSDRLSLTFWRDWLDRSESLSPITFIRQLLEQQIISQHLSVAARRFDGGAQRLRLSIEEEGLTVLAPQDLPLGVTPDRLFTALSLMAECRKIHLDKTGWTFAGIG